MTFAPLGGCGFGGDPGDLSGMCGGDDPTAPTSFLAGSACGGSGAVALGPLVAAACRGDRHTARALPAVCPRDGGHTCSVLEVWLLDGDHGPLI